MSKKPGFSLIEVVIGTMLSAIIMGVLYSSFTQIRKALDQSNYVIDVHTQIITLYNQLEKDLTGAFVPSKLSDQKLAQEQTSTQDQKDMPDILKELLGRNNEPEKKAAPAEEHEPEKKLEKIFYSENDKESLKLLTFITTSALQVYGEVTPRNVRIVYRLVPDKNPEGTFTLIRQESTNLEFKAFEETGNKKIRSYPLATGIQRFSVKFLYEKEDEKREGAPELIAVMQWGGPEHEEQHKKILPQYIEITGVLIDALRGREREYIFKYMIPAYGSQTSPKKEQEKKEHEKKEAASEPIKPAQAPKLPT